MLSTQQKAVRCFTALLYSAAAVGAIWLTVRFLLPWIAPFLVAFALAALLELPLRALVRHGWRRSLTAGAMTLSVLALIVWGLIAATSRAISAAAEFARQAPALMSGVGATVERVEQRVSAYIAAAPEEVADYLITALDSVGSAVFALPAAASEWALNAVAKAAQASPDTLLFIVTAGIGTYFILASFPRTTAFLSAQLPDSLRLKIEGLGRDLKASFGGFFRAQLILMAMTFFELLIAFLLLRVKGAVGLAAATALIDALPVFGTGIVLVPWALCSLLLGSSARGIGLLICWGAVNLIRSCAQAKLLGDQIGLDPIASLLAIYVGWRVWRVWGMLLFPILLVTLTRLNAKGVIRLWKGV